MEGIMSSDHKKSIRVIVGGVVVLLSLFSVKFLWAKDPQVTNQSTKAKANIVVAGKVSGAAMTQAKPPLPPLPPPLITTISEGKRQITIRNSPREPVRAVAQIEVIDNVYGNGLLKFTNVSGKNLAALSGEFVITTETGDVLRDGWSLSSFRSRGFTAVGSSLEFPVAGPIRPVVDPPHKIARIGVRITGVVYDDRSYWGTEGLSMAQKMALDAKNTLLLAEKIRTECLQMSKEELEREFARSLTDSVLLSEWQGGRFDLDYRNHRLFRRALLDENNLLKPDYLQILDGIIENCKKMSD
jgi:hypothetical protein